MASRNSSTIRLQEIPLPLRHPRSKRYTLLKNLRDVEIMLTSMPPVLATLKLTISYMEMTLFSTVSFPYFFKPATNLMTSNPSPALAFGKLFNIKVLPALNTNIYFGFHFRLFLDPFGSGFILPKLSGSRIETKAKQKCSSSNLFKP